ncbi:hypothetical protein U1P98_13610 [Lysinibacillus irui]|uniref:Uncharacterized protein n=1 Tax=Lysinibacillus irui TaxID=2998077 RepID=A0ABU5NMZ1_9BACI|nr:MULTISPECIES: hypothetical protein [Lysinibacillus]MEA0556266.1 hypothetical protein [Lysinibacillus irui]MEA0562795.1 hypothetical protein [Lysinibacillus irui]MEA0977339.1 hypothetical protein [Lysinibacillus irui]MEA1043493.1 hypothetical protein [Lysinibacillus irui]
MFNYRVISLSNFVTIHLRKNKLGKQEKGYGAQDYQELQNG